MRPAGAHRAAAPLGRAPAVDANPVRIGFCDRRQTWFQARQRGLRGRVIHDEARALKPKTGADDETHQKIELGIAIEFGVAHNALTRRCSHKFRIACAVCVDPGVAL